MKSIGQQRLDWWAQHRTCHRCSLSSLSCYRETMRNGIARPVLICDHCGAPGAYVPKRLLRVRLRDLPAKPATIACTLRLEEVAK